MIICNCKFLIVLIVVVGSVLVVLVMVQLVKQQVVQVQNEVVQVQQVVVQVGQVVDQVINVVVVVLVQVNGGGQIWVSIDIDGNGIISKIEVQVNVGLVQVFDQVDINKDGELSVDEYKVYVVVQQVGVGGVVQVVQGR